jgi:hypothetical protein
MRYELTDYVARSTRQLWAVYHLLQSLRALATGRRLEWDYECVGLNA